jgi:sugar lactone lactonase YvrE
MFAVGGQRGVAVLAYEPGAVERLHNLPTDSDPEGLAFSPDGRVLATGGVDGVVRLWDVASGELLRSLEGHTTQISGLAFSPDGSILASTSVYRDHNILIWDPATGVRVDEILLAGAPSSLAYSPDGRWIGVPVLSLDSTISLYTLSGEDLLVVTTDEPYILPLSVAFSPDGLMVAAGGYYANAEANRPEANVRVWRILEGGMEPALTFEMEEPSAQTAASSVSYSPGGQILAVAGTGSRLELRDAQSGEMLHVLNTMSSGGYQSVAFSPDGRILALGRVEPGDTILWEIAGLYDASPRVLSWQTPNLIGSDVWQVEQRFIELGYLEAGLDDGVFDDGLVGVVRSFQAANHLPEDGVVGPETRERLFSSRAVALVPPPVTVMPAETPLPVTTTPMGAANVQTDRPSQQDILEIPSIWEFYGLAAGLDLEAPGRRLYSVDVDPQMRFVWPFYWCAADEEILAENLSAMTVSFEVDGVPVAPVDRLEYELASEVWRCHHWAILLHDWQPGSEVFLDTRFAFSQSVSDGYQEYPAGEYAFTLKATVSGSDE